VLVGTGKGGRDPPPIAITRPTPPSTYASPYTSANMAMALEPKLWHSGEYYLRVEDIVLVGEDRCEFLTGFDRAIFEL